VTHTPPIKAFSRPPLGGAIIGGRFFVGSSAWSLMIPVAAAADTMR